MAKAKSTKSAKGSVKLQAKSEKPKIKSEKVKVKSEKKEVKVKSKKIQEKSQPTLVGKSLKSIAVKDFVSTNEKLVKFSQLKEKAIILFFYPKDNTSGCTTQSQNFRDQLPDFQKLGATVVGISPDSIKSHLKFIDNHSLNFPLISDIDKEMCEAFGVWKQKSMYGRKYMGVERSTFIIGSEGKIIKEWRKVKVPEHVAEVLSFVESL